MERKSENYLRVATIVVKMSGFGKSKDKAALTNYLRLCLRRYYDHNGALDHHYSMMEQCGVIVLRYA